MSVKNTTFDDTSDVSRIPTFRPDVRSKALGTWKLADAAVKVNYLASLYPSCPLLSTSHPLGSRTRGNNGGLMFLTDKGDMGVFLYHEDHETASFTDPNPLVGIASATAETAKQAYLTNLCYAGKWRMEKTEGRVNIKIKSSSYVNIKDEPIVRLLQHCRPKEGQGQGDMILSSIQTRTSAFVSTFDKYRWSRPPPSDNTSESFLVGAWDVYSMSITDSSGIKSPVCSERPRGYAFFDASGYFGLLATDNSSPAVEIDTWAFTDKDIASDKAKTAFAGSFSYYGTYALEDDKLTQRMWHCSYPVWSDQVLIQSASYDKVSNLLTLTSKSGSNDVTKGSFQVTVTLKKLL